MDKTFLTANNYNKTKVSAHKNAGLYKKLLCIFFIIKPTLDLSGYAYHHFTQLMFMICGVFGKTFFFDLIYLRCFYRFILD